MNNPTDPFGHFTPKPQTPTVRKAANFLEAFKDNAVRRPAADKVNSADFRPGTDLSVSQAFDQEAQKQQEQKIRAEERLLAKQQEEEQQARFKAKENQVKKEIETLRDAILKIVKSTANLSFEVEKAAFIPPAAPGVYHLNFFEKLKATLELIKHRIDDAASWMHTTNQRQKRMPFFWQQVHKSGTKYMLSEERSVSTSMG